MHLPCAFEVALSFSVGGLVLVVFFVQRVVPLLLLANYDLHRLRELRVRRVLVKVVSLRT